MRFNLIGNRAFCSYDTTIILPGDSDRRASCRTRATFLAPNLKLRDHTFHIVDILQSDKVFEIIDFRD